MSITSVKPVPTLKGMFTETKVSHRKDFLRENKLNLRELQRVVTKNKICQQQEIQEKQQKQQHLHQEQQQQYVNRRLASQQRIPPLKKRSLSQQRSGEIQTQQSNFIPCKNCCGDGVNNFGRKSTCSIDSKISCDKEIQTDDINDEDFLYEALKKCSSSELNIHSSTKVNYNDADQKTQPKEVKVQSLNNCEEHNGDNHSICHGARELHEQLNTQSEIKQNGHQRYNDNDHYSNYSARSQFSGQLNGHHQEAEEELNLGTLAIDSNCNQQQPINMPLSGGSRRTNVSAQSENQTKKKQIGRNDVRLPKYLEREKREKQEQRIRQLERDPNCPIGHFALTNDERLTALAMTEKKFKTLVNELNHMPMTTQTLRIRTRKAEIEKELAMLEADIRMYSKEKVYVKQFEP